MDPRAAKGDDDAEQAPRGGRRALLQGDPDVGEADRRGPLIGREEAELASHLGP